MLQLIFSNPKIACIRVLAVFVMVITREKVSDCEAIIEVNKKEKLALQAQVMAVTVFGMLGIMMMILFW